MNISVCPGLPLVNLFLVLPSTLKLIKTNKYTLVFSHLNFDMLKSLLTFLKIKALVWAAIIILEKEKKRLEQQTEASSYDHKTVTADSLGDK